MGGAKTVLLVNGPYFLGIVNKHPQIFLREKNWVIGGTNKYKWLWSEDFL